MSSSRPHKQKWSASEDAALIAAVKKLGTKSWKDISDLVPGRSGKQCRERYTGQLAPSISKEIWTSDEDEALISAQKIHGNRWALISKILTGRSSISVKNRWGWIQRHGILKKNHGDNEKINQIQDISPETIGPNVNRDHTYFVPLEVPNPSLFGDGFLQFQKALSI